VEERLRIALKHVRIGNELRGPGSCISADNLAGSNVRKVFLHGQEAQAMSAVAEGVDLDALEHAARRSPGCLPENPAWR
jgi:hypothetical protein